MLSMSSEGDMILDNDELLDLVDEHDRVIGSWSRSAIYREGLRNFRVVNAFLVNDEGQIWIPRRSASKRIFPLCLDMSVGGHVTSGESYDEAFRRELLEELGMHLDEVEWRFLGHLSPHEHNVSAFMRVYEIRSNLEPAFNRDDFIDFYWLNPKEVLDQLEQGDKGKDDLPKLISRFYQCQD